jgi:hypothetical protein
MLAWKKLETAMLMNKILVVIAFMLLTFGLSGGVLAQTLPSSTNYNLPESYIGPGGSLDSSSPSYRSNDTAGDVGIGTSSSANFQSQSGFNTTNEPTLSLIVNSSSVAFGSLSTSAATTGTATFRVLNYTSHGYSVYTVGNPPSNSGHTLAGITSTGPSQAGVEQYGINLRANSSPVALGAEPVQVPSTNFSFGGASTGYSTVNNYRYVAGERIAQADVSSGQTNYTISYIVNVSTDSPGGRYTGTQGLVIVGTY